MTIIELLHKAETKLAASGIDTPRLDSEVLLAHTLGIERIDLYMQRESKPTEDKVNGFKDLIDRRAKREPLAYIIGSKEFWSMPIKVTSNVLVPRPETEHLVERVLEIIEDRSKHVNILDLCTGSGNIPLALASEFSNARFTITDNSEAAMRVAIENLSDIKDRIETHTGDIFDALTVETKFDLITANPPYAKTSDRPTLMPEVVEYEPESAVFGGTDGLDLISRIIKDSPRYLKKGGWLVMEIGIDQAEDVLRLAKDHNCYSDIKVKEDLAGIERIVSLRTHPSPL